MKRFRLLVLLLIAALAIVPAVSACTSGGGGDDNVMPIASLLEESYAYGQQVDLTPEVTNGYTLTGITILKDEEIVATNPADNLYTFNNSGDYCIVYVANLGSKVKTLSVDIVILDSDAVAPISTSLQTAYNTGVEVDFTPVVTLGYTLTEIVVKKGSVVISTNPENNKLTFNDEGNDYSVVYTATKGLNTKTHTVVFSIVAPVVEVPIINISGIATTGTVFSNIEINPIITYLGSETLTKTLIVKRQGADVTSSVITGSLDDDTAVFNTSVADTYTVTISVNYGGEEPVNANINLVISEKTTLTTGDYGKNYTAIDSASATLAQTAVKVTSASSAFEFKAKLINTSLGFEASGLASNQELMAFAVVFAYEDKFDIILLDFASASINGSGQIGSGESKYKVKLYKGLESMSVTKNDVPDEVFDNGVLGPAENVFVSFFRGIQGNGKAQYGVTANLGDTAINPRFSDASTYTGEVDIYVGTINTNVTVNHMHVDTPITSVLEGPYTEADTVDLSPTLLAVGKTLPTYGGNATAYNWEIDSVRVFDADGYEQIVADYTAYQFPDIGEYTVLYTAKARVNDLASTAHELKTISLAVSVTIDESPSYDPVEVTLPETMMFGERFVDLTPVIRGGYTLTQIDVVLDGGETPEITFTPAQSASYAAYDFASDGEYTIIYTVEKGGSSKTFERVVTVTAEPVPTINVTNWSESGKIRTPIEITAGYTYTGEATPVTTEILVEFGGSNVASSVLSSVSGLNATFTAEEVGEYTFTFRVNYGTEYVEAIRAITLSEYAVMDGTSFKATNSLEASLYQTATDTSLVGEGAFELVTNLNNPSFNWSATADNGKHFSVNTDIMGFAAIFKYTVSGEVRYDVILIDFSRTYRSTSNHIAEGNRASGSAATGIVIKVFIGRTDLLITKDTAATHTLEDAGEIGAADAIYTSFFRNIRFVGGAIVTEYAVTFNRGVDVMTNAVFAGSNYVGAVSVMLAAVNTNATINMVSMDKPMTMPTLDSLEDGTAYNLTPTFLNRSDGNKSNYGLTANGLRVFDAEGNQLSVASPTSFIFPDPGKYYLYYEALSGMNGQGVSAKAAKISTFVMEVMVAESDSYMPIYSDIINGDQFSTEDTISLAPLAVKNGYSLTKIQILDADDSDNILRTIEGADLENPTHQISAIGNYKIVYHATKGGTNKQLAISIVIVAEYVPVISPIADCSVYLNTEVAINPVVTYQGSENMRTVLLVEDATSTDVTATVIAGTLEDGNAAFKALTSGVYTVTITVEYGDTYQKSVSTSFTITVLPATNGTFTTSGVITYSATGSTSGDVEDAIAFMNGYYKGAVEFKVNLTNRSLNWVNATGTSISANTTAMGFTFVMLRDDGKYDIIFMDFAGTQIIADNKITDGGKIITRYYIGVSSLNIKDATQTGAFTPEVGKLGPAPEIYISLQRRIDATGAARYGISYNMADNITNNVLFCNTDYSGRLKLGLSTVNSNVDFSRVLALNPIVSKLKEEYTTADVIDLTPTLYEVNDHPYSVTGLQYQYKMISLKIFGANGTTLYADLTSGGYDAYTFTESGTYYIYYEANAHINTNQSATNKKVSSIRVKVVINPA